MGAKPSRVGPPKWPTERLTWDGLVELTKRYLSDPADREVEEEFFSECLAKIKRVVEAYVYRKRIPNLVIHDAVSLAQLNLVRGVHTVESTEKFENWLIALTRYAAITEFLRLVVGRAEKERTAVPLVTNNAEGKTTQTLDLKQHKAATQEWLAGSVSLAAGAYEDLERLQIFERLLRTHMERAKKIRDRDSGLWIKTVIEEHLSVEEIAERRRTTAADVYHLFADDTRLLRKIYSELSGDRK